ncbi:FHS family L-fucose permease-like MFS transporter [Pedobacter africanus]|uniref:Glucose/galactose transporter n=1 Tax=Pedobacter africanus TaxID=151894 RepID=A0ACC6L1U1_9SPHI|nr:sugar MFS transporter [Pedobacter africanus]MDR6785451.1 glucose/galactose transporter [Pedobacter africanus]
MNSTQPQSRTAIFPMVICCALFFILGFVTWANGSLIPFAKKAFDLETDLQAYLVTFASYIAYFFLAIPSSWILKKIGFHNGLVWSLVILALGSLLFIPAAEKSSYGLFLTAIFVQGSGMALLQTAVNPYLSIIGPIDSAAQRISIAGFCNKTAGMVAPIVLSTLLLKGANAAEARLAQAASEAEKQTILDELLRQLHAPYIALAVVLALFAIVLKFVKLPEVNMEEEEVSEKSTAHSKKTIFSYPHLFLGALAIFFCVAVEVMAGDIIGTYARELGTVPHVFRDNATAFTLGFMLVGYLIGIITIPRFISQQAALRICTSVGIVFTVLSVFTSGVISFWFVALLGLANSLMWPAIFPLGIKGLGKFTKTGSAIMIMGIAGGAIWPLVYGFMKDKLHIDFQHAFLYAMLPAYLYIVYFASAGHKVGKSH